MFTILYVYNSGKATADDVLLTVKEAMDIGKSKFNVKSNLILCNVFGFPHYSLRIIRKPK